MRDMYKLEYVRSIGVNEVRAKVCGLLQEIHTCSFVVARLSCLDTITDVHLSYHTWCGVLYD